MRHGTDSAVRADWYVHKPTRVEAMQYLPETTNAVFELLDSWDVVYFMGPPGLVHIGTPEGTKPLLYGSWVVRGTVGEVWPVRDDVFQRSYVESDGSPKTT